MSTNLSVTKSMLAKLLAGEKLEVVHRNIPTAMIDLKTRTLYLPIWEDMTSELYDLLGGHEVGHALNTPPEGWHSATHDANGKFLGAFKDVLNVCEDARIEKLVKRKYPGLSKSFVIGYKSLYERDFFGIKKLKDYSKLNLIDRINLYCKCGAFLIVPFSDEERTILREVENTETWEQVVDVAKRLYEIAKQNQDNQLNSLQDLTEELMRQFEEEMQDLDLSDDQTSTNWSDDDSNDEDSELSEEDSDSNDEESDMDTADGSESTESDEESEDDSSGEGDGSSDEESEEDSEEESSGSGESDEESEESSDEESEDDGAPSDEGGKDSDGESNEPQSITDRKFRERERELIAEAVEIYTYNLPKPDLSRIIVPNKVFLDNFYEVLATTQARYGKRDPIAETCAKRFAENNNRYINLLVKEFEMRKNASQYARTETARTGELDMSKLHKYRYSNDLFRKINVVPKGKSHGMIMFVDMSISMDSMFGPTMEQTLALVSFCRKVGIPFDVYGFSDKGEFLRNLSARGKLARNFYGQKFMRLNDDKYSISEEGFHLIHFISSQFNGNHYRRAFEAMCVAAMNWKNRMYARTPLDWDSMGFDLGGTPFTQAVMASRPMIEKFKAETRTDIVNVIYLTDGDGTGCFNFYDVKNSPINPETGKPRIENRIFLIDQKTRRRVELTKNTLTYSDGPDHQVALTEFVRSVTGCKHIGFYVADGYAAREKIRYLKGNVSDEESKNIDKFFREHGYYSAPNIGYDMYYYVKANNSNIKDADYQIDENMTGKKIAKVFMDAQNDKRKHRVLVSKFAQDIAA